MANEGSVAELGAVFLCGELNVANEPRPDYAAYVANWLRVLKNDTWAIFTAADAAVAMQPSKEPGLNKVFGLGLAP